MQPPWCTNACFSVFQWTVDMMSCEAAESLKCTPQGSPWHAHYREVPGVCTTGGVPDVYTVGESLGARLGGVPDLYSTGSPRCVRFLGESLVCTFQGSIRCIHPRGVPGVYITGKSQVCAS